MTLKEYRTRRYRASAVAAPTCGKQESDTIIVRLTHTEQESAMLAATGHLLAVARA